VSDNTPYQYFKISPANNHINEIHTMTGTLFLIPNTLGYTEGQQEGLLAKIIPDTVQAMTAQLSYFVAENARLPELI